MHPVGFEPTSTNTFELESNPLDRSGTDARTILLHEVSILGPLGYEPNTLPLRHGADVRGSRQNIQILYLCTKQIIHNFIFALKDTGHAENDGG